MTVFFIRDSLGLRSRFVANCSGKIEQFTDIFGWIGALQCLQTDFGAPCRARQVLVFVFLEGFDPQVVTALIYT